MEYSSLVAIVLKPDRPIHHLNKLFTDRQTKAAATEFTRCRGSSLAETGKDDISLIVRYPDTGIEHHKVEYKR